MGEFESAAAPIAAMLREVGETIAVTMKPVREALDQVDRILTPKPGSKPINAATIAAMLKETDDE
jgi:hypothetical protein